jgi:hypothetical protein
MLSAALHLIPYAAVAAASVLGLAATITVMRSGRLNALAFAVGFVAGQLVACAVLVLIGGAVISGRQTKHPTFLALLELAFGVVLVLFALKLSRAPRKAEPAADGRTKKVLARLERVGLFTALLAGLLLGIGGPKRLVLTALAASSISASGVIGSKEVLLVVWYGALASVLVWAPVLAFVLVGKRAVTAMDGAQQWLIRNQPQVWVYALVALGLVLIVDAVVALV